MSTLADGSLFVSSSPVSLGGDSLTGDDDMIFIDDLLLYRNTEDIDVLCTFVIDIEANNVFFNNI